MDPVKDNANLIENLPKDLLIGKNLDRVDFASIIQKNQLLGFYFSSSRCPLSRGFTPILSELYQTWKNSGVLIEVIFIPLDDDWASQDEVIQYFREMSWTMLNLLDSSKPNPRKFLIEKFNIKSVPQFIILDLKTQAIIDKMDLSEIIN